MAGQDLDEAARLIRKRYPALSDAEAEEIATLVSAAPHSKKDDRVALIATVPPTFSIRAKSTKITVDSMVRGASGSILITPDLTEC